MRNADIKLGNVRWAYAIPVYYSRSSGVMCNAFFYRTISSVATCFHKKLNPKSYDYDTTVQYAGAAFIMADAQYVLPRSAKNMELPLRYKMHAFHSSFPYSLVIKYAICLYAIYPVVEGGIDICQPG